MKFTEYAFIPLRNMLLIRKYMAMLSIFLKRGEIEVAITRSKFRADYAIGILEYDA